MAKTEVDLIDDLTVEFNQKKKLSDFIVKMNGDRILNDKEITFTELGKKELTITYINNYKTKVSYSFFVEVVDKIEPLIWLNEKYSIKKDSETPLTDSILCGDNYDSNPNCFIEGEYDIHTVGTYPLIFKAVDSSGNKAEQPFTLSVYEPNSTTEETKEPALVDIETIIADYKHENTQIGLDISSWQGDIDFEKIKQAGVEFVIIRVGSKNSSKQYFLDKKFKQNIEQANKHKIPVGIYFYSYATSIEDAKKDAKWVLKQIKDYDVSLPIAFDWEDWGNFNQYQLSFFGLTSMAEAFLEEIEQAGYQGMLYSSKNYLENIWFPTKYDIWLAHYTKETTYQGNYQFWQLTSNGKVEGIKTPVDINIRYIKK